MSADAARLRALQSLLGATPAPVGAIPTLQGPPLTAEDEAQYRVDLAKLTGQPIDLGEVGGTYTPIARPTSDTAPALATTVPVGEPDLSRVTGGGASLPGGVLHAMTGAELPPMPEPSATPAAREFQPIAGTAPQGDGIPDAVRAYVTQQPQGPGQAEQELLDAQEQARRLRLYEGLGHAGATIGAAIGRIPVDEGFWHDVSRQTGIPVENLRQLQAVRAIAAAKNPASEENRRAREAYAALLPEVATQPGWQSVTKDEIPAFLSDARFRAQAAAREQAQAKAQAMDEARLAETKRHNLVNESRPVGQPQGPAPKAEPFVAPGYRLTPGAKPSNFELGKFREALAAQKQIAGDINALRDLHQKHGTELAGDAAAQMSALVSDLKLKVKDLAALGALSGSDLALLTAQIADPTSLGSNLKALVGNDTTAARLGEFEKIVNGALRAKQEALGIVPDESGATTQPAGSFNLDDSAEMVDVVAPDGTRGRLPKAKLDAALKRGFRLVGS